MTIELKNLCKSFGEHVLFKDFSYLFENGKLYAITGKSGSGKTTLLNMIGLLEKIDSGDIIIDNHKRWNKKAIRKFYQEKISFLFQNYALIEHYTVEQNLRLILEKKDENKIKDVLNQLHISELYHQKVYTLSGGQQQRVAIARVLLHDTDIVLCDEPTGNLDLENKEIIFRILKQLALQYNKIVIMVTHDMTLAKQSDVIIDLDNLAN